MAGAARGRKRTAPARPTRAAPQGGELALIELIRGRAAAAQMGTRQSLQSLRLGIGDDCAILTPPAGHELLVTTDLSLEGRHFRRDWHPAASVGHRTLARGLSDLAAMGARPLAAFLSLALPGSVARDRRWVGNFLDGLLALARQYGVPLAGGDTAESLGTSGSNRGPVEGHILADIVLLGTAPAGRALRRSGARAGDILFCTGRLGGAATELDGLESSPQHFRRAQARGDHPHLFPQPRLAVGQALLRRGLASACIDLSDGLSTDLAHLCDASSQERSGDDPGRAKSFRRGSSPGTPMVLGAEVRAADLPLHPLASALAAERALAAALHGGEDYELLFTARPSVRVPRSLAGVPISAIGRMVNVRPGEPQVTLIDADGQRSPLPAQGWEHLR